MTRSNNDRASTGNTAVSAMAVECNTINEPQEQNITDLLANLMHLCDGEDLDFAEILRMAEMHYQAELGEQAPANEYYAGLS